MATPFSEKNKLFTDKCHLLAQEKVYPFLFDIQKEDEIEFVDTSLGTNEKNTILDGQMAVDRLIRVKKEGFNAPLDFIFQERFREPRYYDFRDITITEWNHATNLPSELYKLNAGLFVYGYANQPLILNDKDVITHEPDGFIEVVIIDTAKLLIQLIRNKIEYGSEINQRSEQTFITLSFDQLKQAGCLLITFNWNGAK